MQIFLFFALFIAVIAVVFAVQNNAPTTVSFFIWKFNGSLALILLVSLAAGALISFFASLPSNIKIRWAIRQQRKKLNELEASLATNKQKLEELQLESNLRQKGEEAQEAGEAQVIETKPANEPDRK